MPKVIEAIICILLILFFLWKLSPSIKKDLKSSIEQKPENPNPEDITATVSFLSNLVKQFAESSYRRSHGSPLTDSNGQILEIGDTVTFLFGEKNMSGYITLNITENNSLMESNPYIIISKTDGEETSIFLDDITELTKTA